MWASKIADPDRTVSRLYDMLDALDATNVDAKGLPFTVSSMLPVERKFFSDRSTLPRSALSS